MTMNFIRHPRRGAARLSAVALAATAGALILGGCGTSSVSGVIDPVAKAATVSNSVPGYRMNMLVQMSSPALPSAITATGSGSFDVRDRAATLSMDMHMPDVPQIRQVLGSSTLHIEERTRQLTMYMKMPAALSGKIPGGKPWWKLDLAQAAAAQGMPGLSALSASPAGSDPSQFMQFLRGAGSVKKVGSDVVAGYRTTHYHVTVDLDRAVARVPADKRAAVRQTIQKLESMLHARSMPVEVWVDSGHLIRRLLIHMSLSIPSSGAMTMAVQLTIPSYGPQAEPQLPPADQVVDLEKLMRAMGQGAAGAPAPTS